MAECNSIAEPQPTDLQVLKSTKIMVYVEEALQDILVVSYVFDSRFFQGILLDSSKRRIPTGIPLSISPKILGAAANKTITVANDDDILHKAINQRFTYFQDVHPNGASGKYSAKRTKNGKLKNARMNVRLRPRQVLCSKCRSICNENSDNVDLTKKTAAASGDRPGSKLAVAVENSRRSLRLSSSNTIEKSPRPLLYESFKNHQMKTRRSEETPAMLTPSLVPKLSRLQPNEITSALNGKYSPKLTLLNGSYLKPLIASPKSESIDNKYCLAEVDQELAVSLPETGSIPQKSAVDMEEAVASARLEPLNAAAITTAAVAVASEENGKMVLRKKHSVGSMEDLWDESIFEDQLHKTKTTPVLKISFGTEGQGTVLKIPAKLTNNLSENEEPDEDCRVVETRSSLRASRKAHKAHKKAKKEAKKRMIVITSPARSPAYENFFCHRSRHKIKHKRNKHKTKATVDNDALEADCTSLSSSTSSERRDSETERSKNEKLSISFKRLEGNEYTATRTESHVDSSSDGQLIADTDSDSESELKPCESGYSHRTKGGRTIEVGDIVWSKMNGCYWWPSKVLSFKTSIKNRSNKYYACVSFFGTSTQSDVSCDDICPFLDSYKVSNSSSSTLAEWLRFNAITLKKLKNYNHVRTVTFQSRFDKSKKSGQYKDAVKVAIMETKKKRGLQMRSRNPTNGNSATSSGGSQSF